MSEAGVTPTLASAHPLARLFDPGTVRSRCAAVTHSVTVDLSPYFTLDRSRLADVADRVAALTLRRYPDLRIPYHSRWRHFEVGGLDRKAELDGLLAGRSVQDVARARFDLTVVSVLLDAGAGGGWSYSERRQLDAAALPVQRQSSDDLLSLLDRAAKGPESTPAPADAAEGTDTRPAAVPSDVLRRSEGLGVATLRAFAAGVFSAAGQDPLRADAATLKLVDPAVLRGVFQVTPTNPLVGLEGRAALIARLGGVLAGEAARSGLPARPGLLFDQLTAAGRSEVSATELLLAVLRLLAPVFTSGQRVLGLPAGDVWPHRWAGDLTGDGSHDRMSGGWVPFHKLSQWLSYSLIEPLQWAGVRVTGLDALTGLPEYRNGGLLLDGGVIVPRDPRDLDRLWKPGDEFIVEWRALTVTLLDELAAAVRQRLGRSAEELPLACVLEGGSWATGREIAAERRPDGAPPLRIDSDGTVF